MDRALKERIIGAVVLVAIAVLVVPVFLDGPAPETRMVSEPVMLPGQSREPGERRTVVLERDRDEPLPDAPARQASRAAPDTGSSDATPARAPAREPPATPDTRVAAADGAGREQAPATEAAPAHEEEPAREEPPATADAGPPAGADAAPSAGSKPAGPAATEATADAATESATGLWAVQIGSFSNKANADRLAASLREEGYAAFLSRHATPSGELHRVRIGPQENRASAEALAAELRAEGLKGQVVPHP